MPSTAARLNSIDREIVGDERILWKGRPGQGLRLRQSDAFLIPFSLVWGGFAIFWETMALRLAPAQNHPAGEIFPIFGIPFVLVGLYVMFGRFFYDAKRRAETDYALTTDRVIIKSGIFSKKVKSLNLKTLPDVSLVENTDGTGTITFAESTNPWGSAVRYNWPGMMSNPAPAYEWIPDARAVYTLMLKAQKSASA